MPEIWTARGLIDARDLGVTLMHEHVFINMNREDRGRGLLLDRELMGQELTGFADAGGATVVELTTAELTEGASPDPTGRYSGMPASGYSENGRRTANNVLALRGISEETNLNIVLGTGHYRDPFLDKGWFDRYDARTIASFMVADLTTGIGETDVRAGIIGEIGADTWRLSAAEERSFQAAGIAQARTGVAVSTHAASWPVGIDQLDALEAAGADPSRVIIGHCDTVNIPQYHEEIAARGAWVQFDTIRKGTAFDLKRRVDLVLHLARKNLLGRLLLSHDVCVRDHLQTAGAGGYSFIPTTFADALVNAGIDREQVMSILTDNPRRALTGE